MSVGISDERRIALRLPGASVAAYTANLLVVGGVTLLGILFVLGFTQADWIGPLDAVPPYDQLVRHAQLFHEVFPYFAAVPPATFAWVAWSCVIALWGAYLLLVWRVRGLPIDTRIVLGGAILLGIVAVVTPPVFSTDPFSYAIFGRLSAIYHQNPYLVTARTAAPGDPVMPYLYWKDIPSPYGPLWTIISRVVVGGEEASPLEMVLRFKVLAFAAVLLDGWLIYSFARLKWQEQAGWIYLAFAWNPLVLLEGVVIGHNDVIILAFILGGAWLLMRARPFAAIGSLTASALIKYSTVPLLGVTGLRLLLRTPVRRWPLFILRALGTVLLVSVCVFLPFWHGYQSVMSTVDEPGRGLNNPFMRLVAWVIGTLSGGLVPVRTAGGMVLLAAGIFLTWQLTTIWRTRFALAHWTIHDELGAWGESLTVFLIVWPRIHSWYFLLPLGLAFAAGTALRRRTFWFLTIVILISYCSYFW
jgi:hypothetical protein